MKQVEMTSNLTGVFTDAAISEGKDIIVETGSN